MGPSSYRLAAPGSSTTCLRCDSRGAISELRETEGARILRGALLSLMSARLTSGSTLLVVAPRRRARTRRPTPATRSRCPADGVEGRAVNEAANRLRDEQSDGRELARAGSARSALARFRHGSTRSRLRFAQRDPRLPMPLSLAGRRRASLSCFREALAPTRVTIQKSIEQRSRRTWM
jgi:hypothetical protein